MGKKRLILFILLIGILFITIISSEQYGFDNKAGEVSIKTSTTTFSGNLTNFTQLADTPDSYTGQANKCVIVGAGETALVFGDCSSASGDITSVIGDFYITNGSTSGIVSLIFNESQLNITIDRRSVGNLSWNESRANLLYANITWNYNQTQSLYFYNQTILYTNGSYIDLIGRQFNVSISASQWFYNQTANKYFYNQTIIYTNGSGIDLVGFQFNLSASITGDNSSWNESRANLLYANITWNYNQTKSAFFYNHTIFISTSGCSLADKVVNVTITNGALNVTCIDDVEGSGSGNPFNQVLNTTSNVTFANITLGGIDVKTWLYNQTATQFFYNQTVLYTNGSYIDLVGNKFNVSTSAIQWFYNQTQSLYFYNHTIFTSQLGCAVGDYVSNVSITNGAINVTCRTDSVGAGGGNPFNQILNTTSNVTFNNITLGGINVQTWLYNQTQTLYFYNQTVLYTNGSYIDLVGRQFNVSTSASQWFYNQTQTLYFYNQTQFTSQLGCSAGNLVRNVSITNGVINVTCVTDSTGSAGNPFNQILNTTSNVTFNNISISKNSEFLQNISASWFKGLFNWVINPGISTRYLTFNGSSLTFSEANMNATIVTHGILSGFNKTYNIFNQDLNTTNQVTFANITATQNISAIIVSAINVTINGSTIYFNGSDYIWK